MNTNKSITEDQLDLMYIIGKDGKASQRQLAKNSGFSIGKVNYCLKALADIGLIKICNFKNSNNKLNYTYMLTPKGIKEKTTITKNLLSKRNKNTINSTHTSIHNMQEAHTNKYSSDFDDDIDLRSFFMFYGRENGLLFL